MNDTPRNKDQLRQRLLVGGTLAFMLLAAMLYFSGGRYVTTDDAYTQAARVDISANIPGRVTRIYVKDNQPVHRGDPLFELDPREHAISLDEAKARLASARLNVAALKASYRQHQAELQSAQETLSYRKREFERQQKLAARHIASQSQFDAAQHALAEAKQKVNSVRQVQMNVRALLGGDPDIEVSIDITNTAPLGGI